jgi:elongation factor Tu
MSFLHDPKRDEEERRLNALPFRMVIEDVFNIKGRGVVVTGRVETGLLEKGDAVFITGGEIPIPSTVNAIEMFGSPEMAWAGDNVGLLLRSVERDYVKRGMVITKQDES